MTDASNGVAPLMDDLDANDESRGGDDDINENDDHVEEDDYPAFNMNDFIGYFALNISAFISSLVFVQFYEL